MRLIELGMTSGNPSSPFTLHRKAHINLVFLIDPHFGDFPFLKLLLFFLFHFRTLFLTESEA